MGRRRYLQPKNTALVENRSSAWVHLPRRECARRVQQGCRTVQRMKNIIYSAALLATNVKPAVRLNDTDTERTSIDPSFPWATHKYSHSPAFISGQDWRVHSCCNDVINGCVRSCASRLPASVSRVDSIQRHDTYLNCS